MFGLLTLDPFSKRFFFDGSYVKMDIKNYGTIKFCSRFWYTFSQRSEVTWRFDDFMSALSYVKCEEINLSIYTEIVCKIHNVTCWSIMGVTLNKKFRANVVSLTVQCLSFLLDEHISKIKHSSISSAFHNLKAQCHFFVYLKVDGGQLESFCYFDHHTHFVTCNHVL